MKLRNKNALVTGAAGRRSIGRAIVRAFAREGADVAIADINERGARELAAEVRRSRRNSLALACDVANREDIDRTVRAVLAAWGRIDILVNAAGITVPAMFLEVTPAAFEKIWRVNMAGTFFMSQQVARHMVARVRGRRVKPGGPATGKIINLSSLSEHTGIPGQTAYAPTKGGIGMLTKCMAVELAPHGIRVNAIGPGFVRTDISKGYDSPRDYLEIAKHIPLNYCARGSDMAGAAVFLASADSDYVTGTTLMVDGGYVACRMNRPVLDGP